MMPPNPPSLGRGDVSAVVANDIDDVGVAAAAAVGQLLLLRRLLLLRLQPLSRSSLSCVMLLRCAALEMSTSSEEDVVVGGGGGVEDGDGCYPVAPPVHLHRLHHQQHHSNGQPAAAVRMKPSTRTDDAGCRWR